MVTTSLGMNSRNDLDRKLKTVAIALFDKSRLEMLRFYVVNNYSPSEIARIMCYETHMVRSRVQHTLSIIDINMIKNDVVYKRLMSLEDVYDYQRSRCKLCGKRKNYGDMLNHLLVSHNEYVMSKLNEVLGV